MNAAERRLRRALMSDFALDNWHNHRVDREGRVIYVGGDPHDEGDWDGNHGHEPGVTHHMADRLDLNLHILTSLNKTKPITVLMASCGGNWEEGMQMAGALVTCPAPVTVIATKHARSMTSIIPLFADRFLMRPPASFMIHHGTWGYEGRADGEAVTYAKQLERDKQSMLDIYVARLKEQGIHSRKTPSSIHAILKERMANEVDVFFSGQEAINWGFADGFWLGDSVSIAKRPDKHRRELMLPLLGGPKATGTSRR